MRQSSDELKLAHRLVGDVDVDGFSIGAERADRGATALVRSIVLREAGTEKRVDLRLAASTPVSGTVVDSSGSPVAGIVLRSGQPKFEVKTGEDGRFTTPGVASDKLTMELVGDGWTVMEPKPDPEHEPAPMSLSSRIPFGRRVEVTGVRPGMDGIRIVLGRDATVTGTVRWGSGEPVARFSVAKSCGGDAVQYGDGDGTFRIENARPGEASLIARTGDGLQQRREVRITPGEANVVDFVLTRATCVVRGQVTDSTGGPAPGVKVQLYSRSFRGEVLSDAQARFAFTVPPGEYGLSANTLSRLVRSRPIRIKGIKVDEDNPETEVNVEGLVTSPGTFDLRVVDKAGKPLPGIDVAIGYVSRGRTDADGRCVFKALAPGKHRVKLSSEEWLGRLEMHIYPRIEGGKTLVREVRVGDGYRLSGRVVSGTDPVQVDVWLGAEEGDWGSCWHTGADGFFSFAGAPAGAVRLSLRLPGRDKSLTRSLDVQGDTAGIEIRLPTGGVRGRALNSGGRPIDGRVVRITRLDVPDDDGKGRIRRGCREGEFEVRYLPDGRYRLELLAGDDVTATTEPVFVQGGKAVEAVELREE